jgi:ubiquinone/menaquinone biosynthesis C-methylase UbiE
MDLSLWKLCQVLGVSPPVWSVRNPLKIYEFAEVVRGAHIQKDDVILDLGCGKGHWTLAVAKQSLKTTGVDTASGQIKVAKQFLRNSRLRRKVTFVCGRLEDLALPSNSHDKVFSFCVLEHVTNLPAVLREVLRILKPGGELHVSVDSLGNIGDENVVAKHRREHAVHQYFSGPTLKTALEDVGFSVLEVRPILTSAYASRQFANRMAGSYKQGLIRRALVYRQFHREDRSSPNSEGVMLIARARK